MNNNEPTLFQAFLPHEMFQDPRPPQALGWPERMRPCRAYERGAPDASLRTEQEATNVTRASLRGTSTVVLFWSRNKGQGRYELLALLLGAVGRY